MVRQPAMMLVPALALLVSWAPFAQAQEGPAVRHLKKKQGEVVRLMKDEPASPKAKETREQELERVISSLLDYEELSRRALIDHWEKRKKKEREEFVSLLRQLVENSYKTNVRRTLDYSVKYEKEEPKESGVVVKTVARSRANRRSKAVSIDYAMQNKGGAWVVYDITTDGVSLVDNYYSQFNKIIAKEGWNGLIQRMKDRVKEETS